jgi:hypothetical protein
MPVIFAAFVIALGLAYTVTHLPAGALGSAIASGLALTVGRVVVGSFAPAVVMAALLADRILPSLDLGPFSVRVYLLVGLGLWAGAVRPVLGRGRFRPWPSVVPWRPVLFGYLGFVGWAVLSRVGWGQPATAIVSAVLSDHVLPICAFISVVGVVRDRRSLRWLAVLAGLTAILSAGVAVLQWLGVHAAWEIASALHADEASQIRMLGLERGGGYVPGLALFSIPLSYHLITLGPLGIGWSFSRARTAVGWAVLAALVALLLASGVLLSQSRSAAYGILLAGLVVGIPHHWHRRPARGDQGRRVRRMLVVGVATLGATAGLVWVVGGDGRGLYDLERLTKFSDRERVALAAESVRFGVANALLGGGVQRFLSEQDQARIGASSGAGPQAPHNLLLNALVYYGVPGLVLLLAFLVALFQMCRQVGRLARSGLVTDAWIPLSLLVGLAAYVVHSMFHNQGFVIGDVLPWWAIGMLVAWAGSQELSPLGGRAPLTPRAQPTLEGTRV